MLPCVIAFLILPRKYVDVEQCASFKKYILRRIQQRELEKLDEEMTFGRKMFRKRAGSFGDDFDTYLSGRKLNIKKNGMHSSSNDLSSEPDNEFSISNDARL